MKLSTDFYKDSRFLRTYNIAQLNHLDMTIVLERGPRKGLAPAHFFLLNGPVGCSRVLTKSKF